MRVTRIYTVLAVLLISGCVHLPGVTLKQAMIDEADALAAGQKEAAKQGITGLLPCDVTVVLEITSIQGGTLSVTGAKLIPEVPFINLGGIGAGASKSETLANTVTIDYKSPQCIEMEEKKPTTTTKTVPTS